MSAPRTLTAKLLESHRVEGSTRPGEELGLRADQTLTQDATGTLVMLELEAMGVSQVQTELSAQYVDHNLLQTDFRNADDHRFLYSACQRFGIWYSGAGNGVSHPIHMERFGRPGAFLVGSDSHTCAGGAMGMLAFGAGGIDVAQAMASKPVILKAPAVRGVELAGKLGPWTSAKDIILEVLRHIGVDGGVGWALEYHGEGLRALSAMDRHVIANMGQETGATASVFPADEAVRRFLAWQGREDQFQPLKADPGARYDEDIRIDLEQLEPLIALPSSPGNVVPVREVAGESLQQAYLGSSANPGYRDFAMPARMLEDHRVHPEVSLDVNPTTRQLVVDLIQTGDMTRLVEAGARIHQPGCNGCIGMGQAPPSGGRSLRTVPRNFPGRSGTADDAIYLCSPETATASAITGKITDPRDLFSGAPPVISRPSGRRTALRLIAPPPPEKARQVTLEKGPNIVSLPRLSPPPDRLDVPVLLSLGDDVSTDEILPAGAKVLPLRSNLPAIAEYTFHRVDPGYLKRAREVREGQGNGSHGSGASHASSASHGSSTSGNSSDSGSGASHASSASHGSSTSGNSSDSGSDSGSGNGHGKSSGGHAVVAGDNYGQGSSREHAALAPRYLGLRLVLASSFSRIHWQNLINFGVLPLRFEDPSQRDRIQMGDRVVIEDLWSQLRAGAPVEASLHKGSAGAASSGAGATPSSAAFSGASATPSSAASSGAGAASTSAGEGEPLRLTHDLSMRKIDQLQAGGVIGWIRQEE